MTYNKYESKGGKGYLFPDLDDVVSANAHGEKIK